MWDLEQLRRFVVHVRSERLYAMWLLFATTGMRRGEVLGLAWDDLDLTAGAVRIRWTLGTVQGEVTWKPLPKTRAGERTLALDPATVDALLGWRKRQAEERLAAGPAWQELARDAHGVTRAGLVFTREDGRVTNPNRVTERFRAICVEAALPVIRLHDVRHVYATAARASATGWHEVKVLSQRLGHASVGITLDTYAHALPAADVAQAHTLARLIVEDG